MRFTFREDIAAQYIRQINSNEPLTPPDGRTTWQRDDFLMLAGIAWGCFGSGGPKPYSAEEFAWLAAEYAEAVRQTFAHDSLAAIDVISYVAMMVVRGEYSQRFGPAVTFEVSEVDQGEGELFEGGKTVEGRAVRILNPT